MRDALRKLESVAFGAIILAMLATSCTACLKGARRAEHRQQSAGALAAVEIYSTCPREDGGPLATLRRAGSGVIVSPRHVLTAWHVIECVNARTLAVLADGRAVPLAVDVAVAHADVVRLMSEDRAPFGAHRRMRGGPLPATGQRLCMATSIPARTVKCGRMAGYLPPVPADIVHSIETTLGNSGSAVYDFQGRLVGIVTHRIPGGGMATSIATMPWIVPEAL